MLRIAAGLAALICDGVRWLWLTLRSSSAVEAENLFLRRQLALYVERGVKPRRIDSVTHIALTMLSTFLDWRDALVAVRPQTLLRWHRQGWKLFWRLKSRPGRPPIPARLQVLIRQMARENSLWGEERIANELRVKLGMQVSPRTVRKYSPSDRGSASRGSTLVDASAHPFLRDPRLRLLCHSDGELSIVVRARGHRTWESQVTALECDRTSQRNRDTAAAARSRGIGEPASVSSS